MTKRNQPGGGIGSKAVAKVTTYMTGHPGMKTNPGGVAQFGEAQGNRAMDRQTNYRGDPVKMGSMPKGVPMGNECAVNTKCGPAVLEP